MADEISRTPEWWRDRLLERYVEDGKERRYNAALYDTLSAVPNFPDGYAEVYKRLLALAKTPWGRLVVDIVSERLKIKGFINEGETDLNSQLWTLFRKNRIEALQRQVHREALAIGTSYVSVWSPDEESDTQMSFESGMSMVHETMPGDPNVTAAAEKVWFDPVTEQLRVNVYLPDGVHKYQTNRKVKETDWLAQVGSGQLQFTTMETVENSLEVCPIVPFVVRPSWDGYGNSDLGDLHAVIGRIDHLTANTLLAIELGALRQKWATGLDVPVDPVTGEPVEPFKVALDRLWVSPDHETKFGSFDQTNVQPYLQAISDAIGQLSAVSRIPTLYFNQSDLSNPPSAASLEASETGLINKVMERADQFSESWELVASLASALSGGMETLDPNLVYTQWADPRTRSEAQTVDAAVKLVSVGLPFEAAMEFVGYAPTEVTRLKAMRAADTFDRLLRTPLTAATPVAGGDQSQPQVEDESTDDGNG